MKKYVLAAAFAACAAPAFAQGFVQTIEDSIGYVKIRDNMVLIETDTGGKFCKINVSEADFAAFALGEEVTGASAVCIDYSVFNGKMVSDASGSFTDVVDASVGYFSVAPGIVAIEGEDDTVICRITLSDEDFDRFAEGGESGVQDARAICIPAQAFDK